MTAIKDWLSKAKTEKPELADFIRDIESCFSSNGFNVSQYEKFLETKLNAFQDEIKESLKTEEDAENKKNND